MKCPACPDPSPDPKHVPNDMTCFATRRGFELLSNERRPFPRTTSIPKWVPLYKAASRAPYEGEPRAEMPLLVVPEPQLWGPRWLDVIIELWAGPIAIDFTRSRQAQRDKVIETVSTLWTSSMKRKIWESVARDGDLRAVRDYLKPIIHGPLPELIDEVEGRA